MRARRAEHHEHQPRGGDADSQDPQAQADFDRKALLYTGAAVTTGVVAGALLITGTALMIHAGRRRPLRPEQRVQLRPGPGGLSLRF
ncbi:MAG: hypothetical protein IPK80_27025 [Nannocystis sp.]|nr:hypothetical protein [Nannocystis sp.]